MGVLQLLARSAQGTRVWESRPHLRLGLDAVEALASRPDISEDEDTRITSIVELLLEYKKEEDEDEKQNILRTLEELVDNNPVELPTDNLEEWEDKLS